MEEEDDIVAILTVFDVVTKQIVLRDTYEITNLNERVCLHCTNSVSHVHFKVIT